MNIKTCKLVYFDMIKHVYFDMIKNWLYIIVLSCAEKFFIPIFMIKNKNKIKIKRDN